MANTPYFTKAESEAKNKETLRDVKNTVQSISAGEGGIVYDTLGEAQGLATKPSDGTIFQVSEITDINNAGYYSFQSAEPNGTRFEKELVEPRINFNENYINDLSSFLFKNISGGFTSGAIYDNGSDTNAFANYFRTSLTSTSSMFNVVSGRRHFYTGEIADAGLAGVVFKDINLNILGYDATSVQVYNKYELSIPKGTAYIASCSKSNNPVLEFKEAEFKESEFIKSLEKIDGYVKSKRVSGITSETFNEGLSALSGGFASGQALSTAGSTVNLAGYFRTSTSSASSAFNVNEKSLYKYTGEIADPNLAGLIFLDSGFNIISIDATEIQVYNKYEFITPEGTAYIASCSKGFESIIEKVIYKVDTTPKQVYVSEGALNGDGSLNKPYGTITEAIVSGAKKITVFEGDYRERIDFRNFESGDYEIIAKEGDKVRILGSDKLDGWITTANASVYKTTFSSVIPTWSRYATPIFEDGNPSHPIIYNERHPLQKGLSNRLPFTPIYKVGTLQEVIDNAGTYFHDTDNSLYIHTSNGSDPSTNGFSYEVAVRGFNVPAEVKTNKKINLSISKLQFMFGTLGVNFRSLNMIYRNHCSALAVNDDGAFKDDSGTIISQYDEIGFCDNDGVNGHFNFFAGYDTLTDHRSMSPQAIYFEPWSHDNHDDGISHHENHNVAIYGGLVEYNGDGGVRASNDSCYIVDRLYSRKNGWDTGVGEGLAVVNPTINLNRNGCKMIATNCFLEENSVGVSTLSQADNVIEVINSILRNNGVELKAGSGKIISRNNRVTNANPSNIKVVQSGTIEVINDDLLI